MSTLSADRMPRIRPRPIIAGAVVIAFIGAMALDTTVIVHGSAEDVREVEFSSEAYGNKQFPIIQESVSDRAVPAPELAAAIAEDQSAAGEQYGVAAGIGPVMPVEFTGTARTASSGVYEVDVEGVPDEITIRVQTGPAINGTDLRDSTGDIAFGQFTNQIEYQNAGSGINNAMKAEVLAGVDTSELTGQAISVVGVFKLINPNNWLVTPVRLSVQ